MRLILNCSDGIDLHFTQDGDEVQIVDSNGAEYYLPNDQAERLREWLSKPAQ